MLSLFPSLLSYQQLSPFLIRLALASVLIFRAYRAMRGSGSNGDSKIVAIVEAAAGVLLVIGLWTQLAALVITADLLVRLFGRFQKRALLTDGVNYYVILLVLSISLLVTGAGWWAFDLPL